MATTFTDVYSHFLSKISDYDILEFDIGDREDVLERYLISAVSEFKKNCQEVDLAYDRDVKEFEADLSDQILEIITTGMAYYWLNPQILNTDNLRNVMNTKDFEMYSPANLLLQLRTLRNDLRKEFTNMIYEYSYLYGRIEELAVN